MYEFNKSEGIELKAIAVKNEETAENLANAIDSTLLDLLIDIILNNTRLDYNDKLTIDDSKAILEFIKALDPDSYECVSMKLLNEKEG